MGGMVGRSVAIVGGLALLAAACAGPTTLGRGASSLPSGSAIVSGQVTGTDGKPLAGIVLLEKGELYNDNFVSGGLVDSRGRFALPVDSGGPWGLHVYSEGHLYFPKAIMVKEGAVNEFEVKMAPDPNPAADPRIHQVTFEQGPGGVVAIRADVSDPRGILGPQVLALNAATGQGYVMRPPRVIRNPKDNYPNGIYTLEYDTRRAAFDEKSWFFVVANHQCFTSRIASYPNLSEAAPKPASVPTVPKMLVLPPGTKPTAEIGHQIFEAICALCHFADRDEAKIGPGLKGVFKHRDLPVTGKPATDEQVRERILNGGEKMPPFKNFSDVQVQSLILYLKTL